MNNVINLQEHKPHLSGNAKCLACDYKWVAVAPIGTVDLECPECGTWKGVYTGLTAPDTVWQCDCGNQHFYISQEDAMCSRCGLRTSLFEIE